MTTMVTGATGFIGSHITGEFRVGSRDCNLLDREETVDFVRSLSPSSIIHCAGIHGSASEMKSNHSAYLDSNILMDSNILHAAHVAGVKNLLLLSSTTIFGGKAEAPYSEGDLIWEPEDALLGYSYSKKFPLFATRSYRKDYGHNWKAAILGNTYGPGMRVSPDATVVGALISRMNEAKAHRKPLKLFGDGSDLRNLTYVGDLNRIFYGLLLDSSVQEPLIVSTSEVVSISELASRIAVRLDFDGPIVFGDAPNSIHKNKTVRSNRLRDHFPQLTFTTLDKGLDATIHYLKLEKDHF